MAGSTALVTTTVTSADHATYTVSADGANLKVRKLGGLGATVVGSPSVTPDQRHFLVIYQDDLAAQSRAFLVPVDPADDASIGLPTPSGTASALAATQFADGTVVVKLDGVGYRAVTATGDAGPLLDSSSFDIHWGDAGSYAILQSPVAPHPMKAVHQDGVEDVFLTDTGDDSRSPLVSPAGRIFLLDGNRSAWMAVPGLASRTLVDPTPCDALMLTGGDGTREFLAVRHAAGNYATFVVHGDTGQVERVPGGATSDVGWFLP